MAQIQLPDGKQVSEWVRYRDGLWMVSTTIWGVVLLRMAWPIPRERAVLWTTLLLTSYLMEQATIGRDWMVASIPERLWVHAQALAVYSLMIMLAIPMHRVSRFNWAISPEGKRKQYLRHAFEQARGASGDFDPSL